MIGNDHLIIQSSDQHTMYDPWAKSSLWLKMVFILLKVCKNKERVTEICVADYMGLQSLKYVLSVLYRKNLLAPKSNTSLSQMR